MISEKRAGQSDEREVLTPHSSSLTPLSIGIDASRSLRAEPTGTERYSQQIIGHMLAAHNDRLAFRLYAPAMPTAEAHARRRPAPARPTRRDRSGAAGQPPVDPPGAGVGGQPPPAARALCAGPRCALPAAGAAAADRRDAA